MTLIKSEDLSEDLSEDTKSFSQVISFNASLEENECVINSVVK